MWQNYRYLIQISIRVPILKENCSTHVWLFSVSLDTRSYWLSSTSRKYRGQQKEMVVWAEKNIFEGKGKTNKLTIIEHR